MKLNNKLKVNFRLFTILGFIELTNTEIKNDNITTPAGLISKTMVS
jgi:hypothetical protein